MSALRQQGKDVQDLSEQRIVVAGAGSAGIGVATALYEAMIAQGLSREQARNQFFVVDIGGVLRASDRDKLSAEQQIFARDDEYAGMSLEGVTRVAKPTVLLGLTACAG